MWLICCIILFLPEITVQIVPLSSKRRGGQNLKESRKFPRHETPHNMVAFKQLANRGYGKLYNISQGGIKMRTLDKINTGEINLLFKLPPSKKPFTVFGKVMWIKKRTVDFDIGIHYPFPNERFCNVIIRFFELKGHRYPIIYKKFPGSPGFKEK